MIVVCSSFLVECRLRLEKDPSAAVAADVDAAVNDNDENDEEEEESSDGATNSFVKEDDEQYEVKASHSISRKQQQVNSSSRFLISCYLLWKLSARGLCLI
jgi:hypothetical protein